MTIRLVFFALALSSLGVSAQQTAAPPTPSTRAEDEARNRAAVNEANRLRAEQERQAAAEAEAKAKGEARAKAARQPAASTEAIGEMLVSGAYDDVLAQVELMERRTGPAPRLESLRALALEGAGRRLEAYRSLLVYTQLTRASKLDGDEAHADLLQLRDKLKEQLQREYEARKEEDAKKRTAAAREILAASTGAERQELAARAEQLRRKHDALIDAVVARPTPEALAELKRQVDSPRARSLDPRILRIPQIETGPIHLGMTASAFQSLLEQRVASFPATSSHVSKYVKSFKATLNPLKNGGNKYYLSNRFKNDLMNDVRYRDYDRVWAQYGPEIEQLNAWVQPPAERAAYSRVVPQAASAWIDELEFDPRGLLSEIRITYSFAREPDARVVGVLQDMFGPPTSRSRFWAPAEHHHTFSYQLGRQAFMTGIFVPPEYQGNDYWLLHLALYGKRPDQ
jgi:hypothetical protein